MSKKQHLDFNRLLPSALKNETLTSLVDNLFNRFVSEEKSVLVNGRIGQQQEGDAPIFLSDLEREINSLVPALYVKTGTEESAFTFSDLVNRLRVLNVDLNRMREWMAEQYFNFHVPIDYDKFSNFGNYYWTGKLEHEINTLPGNPNNDPDYYTIARPKLSTTPLNAWQERNHWHHKNDLAALGFSIDDCEQAKRPIIEYSANLKLNAAIDGAGQPADSGFSIQQDFTSRGQIPQFDLYRYDGTHAGKTSGIFFYVEDPDFSVDTILQKRLKTTADYDFIFGHGLNDELGRLLFFKTVSETSGEEKLDTVWAPGVNEATVTSLVIPNAVGANIAFDTLSESADNQSWTLTFDGEQFNVVGERSGLVGTATPGTPFSCTDFSVQIAPAQYSVGQSFSFNVSNKLSPRFVKKDETGAIVNAETGSEDAVWMTPLRMFQNLERETRNELSYGDLLDHVRSMVRNQDGFVGTSLGLNNVRELDFNPAYGGTIRDFALNFPLLAGMLIQKQVSPITIIDFAEQQYNIALSSIDQFIADRLVPFMAAGNPITIDAISANNDQIKKLLAEFERERAANQNLLEVFGDSTAKVANWPATLPMLGLVPAAQPMVSFDFELGLNIIVHHDGHISPIVERSYDVDREMVKQRVTRSDGTVSAGYFSDTMPAKPYSGQLWLRPSAMELSIFTATFDTDSAPETAIAGQTWFKRSAQELYDWDEVSASWVVSSASPADLWVPFSVETVRNSLMIAVEQKLYDSVHAFQTVKSYLGDADGSEYAEIELARYSLKYGYDTFAPDFNQSDAFTWNYSNANIPGVSEVFSSTPGAFYTPARWYDVYKTHFDIPGSSLPTCRPNIEPWKLLNFSVKPADWDNTYAMNIVGSSNIIAPVNAIATTNVDALTGNLTVDNVQLSIGDRLLLAAQSIPSTNGIYVSTSSGWTRTADVLVNGLTVGCIGGQKLANTVWTITSTGNIVADVTPIAFEQVRLWKQQMWSDIKTQRPDLKLCVNIYNDALLPPYVSTSEFASAEALLTAIPSGISSSYVFGDNGPVEIAWKKSLEYRYGLARSALRLNPLTFVSKCWGDTFVTSYAGGARLERNLVALQPHTSFLMHGEKLNVINTYSEADVKRRVLGSITHQSGVSTAHDIALRVSHVEDNMTIFDVMIDGQLRAQIKEGTEIGQQFVSDGLVFSSDFKIEDLGIPFEMGDTLVIKTFDDVAQPAAFSHIPATTKKFNGLGQWFTNLLRFNFVDTQYSAATQAYRDWQLKLAHRIGALIRQDTLTINTSRGIIPTTAFNLLLKKNANTESKWISGLRVQLVSMGARKTNEFGFFVPKSDASDWVFRIENYSQQNPTVEKYVLDTNGSYQTFNALNGVSTTLEWKRFTDILSVETVTVPRTITGLQAVLDFIYGYVDRLTDLGWKVYPEGSPVTDSETGRNLDWQLEVEKLVDRVFKGMNAGEGHILNPFTGCLVLETPTGLMAQYSSTAFIDTYSAQGAYDVAGAFIPVDKLNVIRTDEQCVTYSNTPIFSAHVFVDEYEHAILFNKRFSDANGASLLFDPFIGARIKTAYLTYIRQEESHGKPTFEGFFLNGNGVSRNLVSSVDASASYYDAAKTFYEPSTAEHALALLGYKKKSYFDKIAVNDSTQFNFWRGLIQSKGTNMTIDSFVNYKKFNDASVDEYWAVKIAEYGDAREKSNPEIKIEPTDTTEKFLRLQFYTNGDGSDFMPHFTHVEASDDTRWFSIDDMGKGLHFEANELSEKVYVSDTLSFPAYIRLANIYHNGDSMQPTVTGPHECSIVNANMIKVNGSGEYTVSGFTWINPSKLSPIKLIDYEESVLVEDIPLWNPAIGIHATAPLEIVNIISLTDPAKYNYTTQTQSNDNYYTLKSWAKKEVGQVWWDTSALGYIPYYDATAFPTLDARLQRWGLLADWASVNLYEWVESSVPPSEYDALASEQEGSAEIDIRQRASGKAARKKYYARNRVINRKPIAWSRAGIGNENAHPAFGPAEYVVVRASGNALIADVGRCEAINLIADRHFGGWSNGKPVGEVKLVGQYEYLIGASAFNFGVNINTPVLIPQAIGNGKEISDLRIESIDNGMFGRRIGQISLTKKSLGQDSFALRMTSLSDGYYEDRTVDDWYSNDPIADNTLILNFETFGLRVLVQRSTFDADEPITAAEIIHAVTNESNDIFVREAIKYEEIIPLPTELFVNDEFSELYSDTEYEWKTWEVPTQNQLSSDLAAPFNAWKPYYGDDVQVSASPAVVEEMNAVGNSFTLSNGETVSRYTIDWTAWQPLNDVRIEAVSDGHTSIVFDINEPVSPNRVSVYVNGVQVNPSGYFVEGTTVTVLNTPLEGYRVLLLYRAYAPSAEELAFDPAVKENFAVQTQYKLDYQYTVIQQRDEDGNPSSAKYYFWVQDKSIPQVGKSMSLVQAQETLTRGPSTYALFARAITNNDAKYPAKFDSCVIAGLSRFVTKGDAYKLRFVRNFTLRDDPEELDLKNTHSEWKLIRKSQARKIPQSLWELVTSAVSGIDSAGNSVPSQARIDYDARNGTRTRFGFEAGQIFADSDLVKASVLDTILNTQVTIRVGKKTIIDYITALDFSKSNEWFATPEQSRETMTLIYNTARASQVNEIFFAVLEDALANNFEFSNIFKTSYITVSSSSTISGALQTEQEDELY